MAQTVVRNLDEDVKLKLQKRARQRGRSTEEEVREILREAARCEPQKSKALGKMGETHGVFPGLSIGDRACAVRRGSAQPTVHKFTAPRNKTG